MDTTEERKPQRVEVSTGIDPEKLAEWYEKHGIKPAEDGSFERAESYGKPPVEEAFILEHVRTNGARNDIPALKAETYISRTFVYVGGGPTVQHHLDEIRAKAEDPSYDVWASNMTVKYLLSKGIKPQYHVIVDPTERKALDLEYECDDITLVLGLQCHPKVYEAAGKRKVLRFLAASATREDGVTDVDVAKEVVTEPMLVITGGSMMGTRALNLAYAAGYRKMEYYGVDASVEYDPEKKRVNAYSYQKHRGENLLKIDTPSGRVFSSTLSLSKQVYEMESIRNMLPGMIVTFYGDSLMTEMMGIYNEARRPADYMATSEYIAMLKEMHKGRFGVTGSIHSPRVYMAASQIARKYGECSVLDYGCGPGQLLKGIQDHFQPLPGVEYREYDPAIDEKSKMPEPADLVVCTDVLEHIEPQCLQTVLGHIASLTGKLAIINVSTREAYKNLPDGRNAHLIVQPTSWWESWLRRYFVILEGQGSWEDTLFVLQPLHVWEEMEAKRRPRGLE